MTMTNTGTTTGPPPLSSPAPPSASDGSAKAIIDGALSTYGLSSLSTWAWQKWQAGESVDQIMLELRSTPEYKQRFPAMDALAQKGRALSETQYINLEQTYTSLSRQFGLPSGFYDQPEDFTALITGEVSPTEYSQRLQDYQSLVYDIDPTTRAELKRLYGVDEGAIAAYFIDPEKALPHLQQQFGATQSAAAAQHAGFGNLSQAEAERLANIDPAQAAQGFGNLVQMGELFTPLEGEGGTGISREQQFGAAFLGDQNAKTAIETKARERVAKFGGGGGFSQSQQGMAGVG